MFMPLSIDRSRAAQARADRPRRSMPGIDLRPGWGPNNAAAQLPNGMSQA